MQLRHLLPFLACALLAGIAFSTAAEARGFVSVGIGVGAPYYGYGYAPAYAYPAPYYYPSYPVAAYPVPSYPPTAYPAPQYYASTAAPAPAPAPNCREYTHTVVISGQKQSVQGEACQQPDGKWKIIN
jgi:hypothetical protein